MQRIRTTRDSEPIGEAFRLLPLGIRERLAHVQVLAGVDPLFVGLHACETTEDGRGYRTTAHACFPIHLAHRPRAERVTTIALPQPCEPWVVVHELGHALDEAIGFDHHRPAPVTAYAETNDMEAFAEAFTAWICPDAYPSAQAYLAADRKTTALFDHLAER